MGADFHCRRTHHRFGPMQRIEVRLSFDVTG
jgi:hypothetical protein